MQDVRGGLATSGYQFWLRCDRHSIPARIEIHETPASDLVEGLLNNVQRPPVAFDKSGRELYAGAPLPHFNEVDECAGIDAIITNRVLTAMGFDPATTLHDVRWGEHYKGDGIDDFVRPFYILGRFRHSILRVDTKAGARMRLLMYFRLGGGTLKGVCKPGAAIGAGSSLRTTNGHAKTPLGHSSGTSSRRD